MAKSGKGTSLLVAAFDFGTTYSGYAFSFQHDPMNVKTNQGWVAGSDRLISLKTSTCVLLDPVGQFSAFGFEAENKYSSLAEDNKHRGWRLFRRFKMMLHNNAELSRLSTVEDINGTSMQALPIFSMAIRFLREHLLEAITKQAIGVNESDIQYVITVPAIWDDDAKQFMREAAIEAGMKTERLKLALEPEAASIWCEQINPDVRMALARPNIQYMVVDLGGGTADISVHEKNNDGSLKEIHRASGGPWGGIFVDGNYFKFLEKLFGKGAIDKLKSDEMSEYFDILREFETKKRIFSSTTTEKITFRTSSTLKDMSEDIVGQSLKQRLVSLNFGDRIVLKGGDKLRVEPDIVREWFDVPINCTIKHIKQLLAEKKMGKVQTILLVGGFGESQYVQGRMAIELSNKRLIVPDEAGLVVLKGAVRFGHEPNIVSSRVMKYTYGISVIGIFDKAIHRPDKMYLLDGVERVADIFKIYVRMGDEIRTNHLLTETSFTSTYAGKSVIHVYRSHEVDPVYTTDPGCERLGVLIINYPDERNRKDNPFDITFMFGDTELLVKVRMQKTGKEESIRIDSLK